MNSAHPPSATPPWISLSDGGVAENSGDLVLESATPVQDVYAVFLVFGPVGTALSAQAERSEAWETWDHAFDPVRIAHAVKSLSRPYRTGRFWDVDPGLGRFARSAGADRPGPTGRKAEPGIRGSGILPEFERRGHATILSPPPHGLRILHSEFDMLRL
jgi:hypothetical protein